MQIQGVMLCTSLSEIKLTKTFFDELILSPTVVHADLVQIPHIFTVGEKNK
jgi:hypothetical protein